MTERETRTERTFRDDDTRREHEVIAPPPVAEGATRVVHAEPVHRDRGDGPMQLSIAPPLRDRVRWGPVWAGLIVAVPTFLLLQLATLALGWWNVGPEATGNNGDLISGINGLIALFLGGLTAAATARWRGVSDGLLHGILVWALAVVTLLFLTLFGGGALLGSFAGVITDLAGLQQSDIPDVQAGQLADAARSGAAWAVLGLGLSIAAAAIGGMLGAKMWPGKKDAEADRYAVA